MQRLETEQRPLLCCTVSDRNVDVAQIELHVKQLFGFKLLTLSLEEPLSIKQVSAISVVFPVIHKTKRKTWGETCTHTAISALSCENLL